MKAKKVYWLFLLPSLCGVLLFFAVPFVFSLYYAVIDNMGSRAFVGLRHFIQTLQNDLFLSAGGNTLIFLLLSVVLGMILALLLALALRRLRRSRALAVSLLLLPMVVPSGTIVQFWRVLFDSNGLLNKLLLQMGFAHSQVAGNQWQMGIIVFIFLWKNVSYNTVLFWSGLNWIPQNYYEQMSLEGAGAFRQFRHVTWVYLGPTTFIVLLMSIVNSFKVFKEIFMLYGAAVTDGNRGDFQSNGIHFVRPGLFPEQPTLQQYTRLLFGSPGYLRMFWNAVLLLIPILTGQLLIAPMAAYGFENIRWRHKEKLYFLYLIVMLMPTQILLVPNFIVAGWLQIRGSYLAIILPALFHPFGVFLIRQQMKGFPKECTEAASLDGAGALQIYRHIILPNLKSVMAAMTVLLFVDNWNIVDQAVVFIEDLYRQPLSVYLGSAGTSLQGIFFAASVIYMIPALLVFLLGQEGLAKGISLSNLK